MSAPLSEMPQRAEASPWMTSSPPRALAPADCGWRSPRSPPRPDIMFSATPTPQLPRTRTWPACSCRRSSNRRGRRSRPRRQFRRRCRERHRVSTGHPASLPPAVQARVERAHGLGANRRHGGAGHGRRGAPIRRPRPCPCRRGRSGSQRNGVLGPGQHRDRRYSGGHRDPLVGLGHDRRLAGDRIAQRREPVGRTHGEGVEPVEIVETALQRLLKRGPSRSDSRPPPRSRPRSRTRSPRAAGRGAACVVSEPLCTQHSPSRSRRVRAGGPGYVAMRVWPRAWLPAISDSEKRSCELRGSPASL